MTMWISHDPECGAYVTSALVATMKTSRGTTLAEEFPESYMEVPRWLGSVMVLHEWCGKKINALIRKRNPSFGCL